MAIQTLSTPSGERLIVLPEEEYEDLIDARRYEAAMREIEHGAVESLNSEEMEVYLAAPSPVAFWRERRGVTRAALAETASITEAELAQIENGDVKGDVGAYARIAKRLRVRMDDIVPD